MYNNGMCGNNCLWIIILLILFCGCGNQGFCGNGIGNANNGGRSPLTFLESVRLR